MRLKPKLLDSIDIESECENNRGGEMWKMLQTVWAGIQAEQHRQEGITCYKEGRFQEAIDAFTAAITLCPGDPEYLEDRALCYQRLKDWQNMESDCKKAIELDNQSVQAHQVLGIALVEKKEYEEGIKVLEMAMDLGRGHHPEEYKLTDIWNTLAKAKYFKWKHDSAERSRELQNFKEACAAALKEKHLRDGSQTEAFVDENVNSIQNQMGALDRVFKKAAENDTPTEVPQYLRCSITLGLFWDPVIAPNGITYERSAILKHLEEVGEFDPTTIESLRSYQLVPNLAVKEAARAFLGKCVVPYCF